MRLSCQWLESKILSFKIKLNLNHKIMWVSTWILHYISWTAFFHMFWYEVPRFCALRIKHMESYLKLLKKNTLKTYEKYFFMLIKFLERYLNNCTLFEYNKYFHCKSLSASFLHSMMLLPKVLFNHLNHLTIFLISQQNMACINVPV